MKVNFKVLCFALAAMAISFVSQAQSLYKSPRASVSTTVGLTEITINYFRPKVNGRTVFGSGQNALEKYGKIWRTGANVGTVLFLNKTVTIEGKELGYGYYQILTIPNADSWTVIFTKTMIGGNIKSHKVENETLRVNVKPTKLSTPVEVMTFNITDISKNNDAASIEFAWADVSFKLKMEIETYK